MKIHSDFYVYQNLQKFEEVFENQRLKENINQIKTITKINQKELICFKEDPLQQIENPFYLENTNEKRSQNRTKDLKKLLRGFKTSFIFNQGEKKIKKEIKMNFGKQIQLISDDIQPVVLYENNDHSESKKYIKKKSPYVKVVGFYIENYILLTNDLIYKSGNIIKLEFKYDRERSKIVKVRNQISYVLELDDYNFSNLQQISSIEILEDKGENYHQTKLFNSGEKNIMIENEKVIVQFVLLNLSQNDTRFVKILQGTIIDSSTAILSNFYNPTYQKVQVYYTTPDVQLVVSLCDLYLIDFDFHFTNCPRNMEEKYTQSWESLFIYIGENSYQIGRNRTNENYMDLLKETDFIPRAQILILTKKSREIIRDDYPLNYRRNLNFIKKMKNSKKLLLGKFQKQKNFVFEFQQLNPSFRILLKNKEEQILELNVQNESQNYTFKEGMSQLFKLNKEISGLLFYKKQKVLIIAQKINSNFYPVLIFKNEEVEKIQEIYLDLAQSQFLFIQQIQFTSEYKILSSLEKYLDTPYSGKTEIMYEQENEKCPQNKQQIKFQMECSNDFWSMTFALLDNQSYCETVIQANTFLVCNNQIKKLIKPLENFKSLCYMSEQII